MDKRSARGIPSRRVKNNASVKTTLFSETFDTKTSLFMTLRQKYKSAETIYEKTYGNFRLLLYAKCVKKHNSNFASKTNNAFHMIRILKIEFSC